MKRRVVILGSTGSIGRSTLQVLAGLRDTFEVVGLAAGTQGDLLVEQTLAWQPACVAIADPGQHAAVAAAVPSTCRVLSGPDAMVALVDAARCDVVVSAMVGAAGLPATWRAVELGRTVALANKEALVVAGDLLTTAARRSGAALLPIDSEHSAVFQALHAGRREDVARIVLTASGGPFRDATPEQMAAATVADALNHPTWAMGPKITVDSATMMNKALEIVEARWLFGVRHDQIEVIVHPESVVHSLVEFVDGSVIAQLGTPDMRTPIQYALTYPKRQAAPAERLCLQTLGRLTFEAPDPDRFPALALGHRVAAAGGTSGAVFNAANEEANALFRAGRIEFNDIVALTRIVLENHDFEAQPDLAALLAADREARRQVQRLHTEKHAPRAT